MTVALLINRHSRVNRRHPEVASRLAEVLGDAGRVIAPADLEELRRQCESLREDPPTAIAIHGGDGTIHHTLTALLRAFGDRPLPPLALLPGGTMNVVTRSLGLRASPERVLAHLAACQRTGTPPATLPRRCIEVGARFGFIFGSGFAATFLDEYYATGRYGRRRALWLLARTLLSLVCGGRLARRLFGRFLTALSVDGRPLQRAERMIAVAAATVREIGLGFKLIHTADQDPERFGVVAIHCRPLALALDVLRVRLGLGVAKRRADNLVGSELCLEPLPGQPLAYTVDGDVYKAEGPLAVRVGPRLQLVLPPS